MAWIFDTFKTVCVSVSGGKDSTVLFDLARREAQRRSRPIKVFFLDQEAEYAETINMIEHIYSHDGIEPYWFQVPCLMTNSTSYQEDMLYAFDPEAKKDWIHPYSDISIKDPLPVNRFYKIMEYWDSLWGEGSCGLVGLRSEESLNRYNAVTHHPALSGVNWSSPGGNGAVKVYPLYDWTFEDIWTYIGTEKLRYHKLYDFMYVKGLNIPNMRVSNLIHEKSFKCLADLQEFEPETYERMVNRLKGVPIAARYAREQMMFSTKKRPAAFKSWLDYRNFLLETYTGDKKQLFIERFAEQTGNETVYRQQVKQLLINDWENNVPVINNHKEQSPLEKWMELL